jgi:O-antigen/teichoic acid export membrane protein
MASKKPASSEDWFSARFAPAELRARAMSGVGSTTARRAIAQTMEFATVLALARLLQPEDFGLIAMVAVFTGFVALFKDMGLSTATIRYPDVTPQQVSNLFWANIVASVLLFAVIVVVAPLLAGFFNEPRVRVLAVALSLGMMLDSAGTQHRALLTRNLRFDLSMRIGIQATFARCATAIVAATCGLGYWALVLGPWAGSIVSAIYAWYYCTWRPGLPQSGARTRPLFNFGLRMFAFNIMAFIATHLHAVIIGRMAGPAAAGLYHRAHTTQRHLLLWVTNAPRQIMPVTMARVAGDTSRVTSYYYRACTLVVTATLPVMFIGLLLPHELVYVLFGPRWDASADVLRFMSIGVVAQALLGTTGWIYASVGAAERMLRWGFLGWGMMMGGTIVGALFMDTYGIQALALGMSLAVLLMVGPGMSYAFKDTELNWHDLMLHLRGPLMAGAVAGLGSWALLTILPPLSPWFRLLLGCLVFVALDLLLLVTVAGQRQLVLDSARMLKQVAAHFRFQKRR